MKPQAFLTAIAFAAAPVVVAASDDPEWGPRHTSFEPAYDAQFRAPRVTTPVETATEIVADGLAHPWAVEVLPDGAGYLVVERPGRLRHVAPDGTVSAPISGVPQVENRKPDTGWATQAGLLDVKIGPDFAEDRMVYLSYAKPLEDEMSATAAARGVLSEDVSRLEQVEDIFVQSPPSPTAMHYGSRIVFDGNGHLFITTGEHSSLAERDFAQQLDKTYGKVIRLRLDGSVPQDNPFVGVPGADPAIWSYGHRNVQGAVMRDGFLLTIEHGPAGGDELNLTLPARNYGWPIVSYGERYAGAGIGTGRPRMPGMEEPLYFWDPVIAPGDLAIVDGEEFPEWSGDVLVGALSALGIVRLDMNGPLVVAEERLLTGFGRVRDVAVDADGSILITTDYDDGALVRARAVR